MKIESSAIFKLSNHLLTEALNKYCSLNSFDFLKACIITLWKHCKFLTTLEHNIEANLKKELPFLNPHKRDYDSQFSIKQLSVFKG